ncbi:hypothetical protein HELRODRAFT_108067, partial [Helobdella robusta]|uniref:ATP synthase subunit d, mitochondrial n=1 Tax=Helobdella robusta TaxID=6412 RepID=T1EEF0_HELRO
MAGRRISKSLIDWAAFAERVPPHQMDYFRAFKSKSDLFVSKVHRYPENIPKIDFAFYKSRIANTALVTEFERAYSAVSVPFPKDKNNLRAVVDEEEKEAMAESKKLIENAQKTISESKDLLAKIDSVPHLEEMTVDLHAYYFPDDAHNPEKPAFWPFTKSYQPENDPHTIK